MFPEVSKALASEGIVESPWPAASWSPSVLLEVRYAEGEVSLGNGLSSVVAKEEPALSFAAEEGSTYTVVCVDPDAPHRATPEYGLLNHWIISGIKKAASGKDVEKTEPCMVAYIPPSNKKTGHRYVFLLYKNPVGTLPPIAEQAQVKGPELMERAFFNLDAFVEENKLELVGINFFLSHNPHVV